MWNQIKGLDKIVDEVVALQQNIKVKKMVENRVLEFLSFKDKDSRSWFEELVYCLLTAYSSALKGQECVDALCECGALIGGTLEEVILALRRQGHRFADRRGEYILEARRFAFGLKTIIQSFEKSAEARIWLRKNIKGLGWKESSHFLRNVGYLDVAIIDRHIISNLIEFNLIQDQKVKGLTKKKYLYYEKILERVADKTGMSLGELDLYLWYRKTGKVLK